MQLDVSMRCGIPPEEEKPAHLPHENKANQTMFRMSALTVARAMGLLVAFFVSVPTALAQCPAGWLPGDDFPGLTYSWIRASTMWDPDGPGPLQPRLVVVGYLQFTGSYSVAQLDGATGTWSQIGTGFFTFNDQSPFAIAAGANGELYMGGQLNAGGCGGCSTEHIARWNGAAWVAMGSGLNGNVYAITVLNNGDVVAGGTFTNAGGTSVSNIARWNGATWSPMGAGAGGMNGAVEALITLANGDVIAGGAFTTAVGVPQANGIARWNGTSWSGLSTGMAGGNVNGNRVGWVLSLALAPGGDIIAGGEFATAGGVSASRIARWNGASWTALGAGVGGFARALLALPNGHIVAGGDFTTAGLQPMAYIAEWNPATSAWNSLSSGTDQPVYTLIRLPNGNIVAGGAYISFAGGVIAPGVGQYNPNTGQWSTLSPGMEFGSEVSALLTAASGDVLAGGTFRHAGWVDAGRIASFNGTNWSASGAGMNDHVRALAQRPNLDFIVGGDFSIVDGVSISRIARWTGSGYVDMDGGISTFLNPNPKVYALAAMNNGDVFVGGDFLGTGGGFSYYIARWNESGWSSPAGGMADGIVRALLPMPNGDVIAGGDFMNAGVGGASVSAPHIARWNGSAWSAIGGGTDGPVNALALKLNGDIVVGGAFAAAGGAFGYNNIASWNGSVWSPLSSGTNAPVNALVVRPNGNVIAGGAFTTAGGLGVNYIARWTGAGWTALGTGLYGIIGPFNVSALAILNNGDIAVGGVFHTAGGAPSTYFARYTFGAVAPVIATQPIGGAVCSATPKTISVTLAPGEYGTVTYQWWRYLNIFPIYQPVGNGPTGNGSVASGAQSASLTISNFQSGDTGQYYCAIAGSCGITPSSEVTLTFAPICCPADIGPPGGNGIINVDDLLAVINAWGPCPAPPALCPADIAPPGPPQGDGIVNVDDLLAVINAWGMCP